MDNKMTFFSGTDTATLLEEGKDRNNFVSLIVNNAGTYTAAITRRIKRKEIKEAVNYEFFNNGEKQDISEYITNINEIEYFYLNIEKEGDDYLFPDLETRLEEIKQNKTEASKAVVAHMSTSKPTSYNYYEYGFKSKNDVEINSEGTEGTLFSDADVSTLETDYTEESYSQVSFDRETIKTLVLQLITGSIIISNDSKIDVSKWSKSMSVLYERRFGKGKEGLDNFKMWADTYTEYLTWYTTDEKLKRLGFDDTEICAICAHNVIKELNKLPENDYIKGYIEALQKYLII